MSRRRRAEKRDCVPDLVYSSTLLAKFINKMMKHGKKTLARKLIYDALDHLSKRVKEKEPLKAFEKALENAKPTVEVKSRRIGGATYQVPVEVSPGRSTSMAMNWIITFARKKSGRSMVQGLSEELADCYNNEGASIKKRDEVHRMAEANRAFAQYKW